MKVYIVIAVIKDHLNNLIIDNFNVKCFSSQQKAEDYLDLLNTQPIKCTSYYIEEKEVEQ